MADVETGKISSAQGGEPGFFREHMLAGTKPTGDETAVVSMGGAYSTTTTQEQRAIRPIDVKLANLDKADIALYMEILPRTRERFEREGCSANSVEMLMEEAYNEFLRERMQRREDPYTTREVVAMVQRQSDVARDRVDRCKPATNETAMGVMKGIKDEMLAPAGRGLVGVTKVVGKGFGEGLVLMFDAGHRVVKTSWRLMKFSARLFNKMGGEEVSGYTRSQERQRKKGLPSRTRAFAVGVEVARPPYKPLLLRMEAEGRALRSNGRLTATDSQVNRQRGAGGGRVVNLDWLFPEPECEESTDRPQVNLTRGKDNGTGKNGSGNNGHRGGGDMSRVGQRVIFDVSQVGVDDVWSDQ